MHIMVLQQLKCDGLAFSLVLLSHVQCAMIHTVLGVVYQDAARRRVPVQKSPKSARGIQEKCEWPSPRGEKASCI